MDTLISLCSIILLLYPRFFPARRHHTPFPKVLLIMEVRLACVMVGTNLLYCPPSAAVEHRRYPWTFLNTLFAYLIILFPIHLPFFLPIFLHCSPDPNKATPWLFFFLFFFPLRSVLLHPYTNMVFLILFCLGNLSLIFSYVPTDVAT